MNNMQHLNNFKHFPLYVQPVVQEKFSEKAYRSQIIQENELDKALNVKVSEFKTPDTLQTQSIFVLPNDVLKYLLHNSSKKDLTGCLIVCKQLNAIAQPLIVAKSLLDLEEDFKKVEESFNSLMKDTSNATGSLDERTIRATPSANTVDKQKANNLAIASFKKHCVSLSQRSTKDKEKMKIRDILKKVMQLKNASQEAYNRNLQDSKKLSEISSTPVVPKRIFFGI